jgi:hypothetical protein
VQSCPGPVFSRPREDFTLTEELTRRSRSKSGDVRDKGASGLSSQSSTPSSEVGACRVVNRATLGTALQLSKFTRELRGQRTSRHLSEVTWVVTGEGIVRRTADSHCMGALDMKLTALGNNQANCRAKKEVTYLNAYWTA